jgi:hypothetical protein
LITGQAEFQKLQSLYRHQKLRVEYSNQALKNKQMAALNFGSRDQIAQIAKHTTNPIQINDYNELRRSTTAMYHADHAKQQHVDTSSYALLNDTLGTRSPATQLPCPSSGREATAPPNGSVYKSADGTIYRHSVDANNVLTEEIDPPTKNVIHVRGKYHELYRQSATLADLPQSLNHKFKPRGIAANTSQLLSDEVKVHDTLAKIYNNGVNKKHNRDVEQNKEIAALLSSRRTSAVNKHRDYDDLGNLLRHSVQRGKTIVYDMGHVKEVHNDEVSRLYLSDQKNIDSPYRRKTDWLSKLKKLIFFTLFIGLVLFCFFFNLTRTLG